MQTWEQASEWERRWHGDCIVSLGEELKQTAYARRMGLKVFPNGKSPLNIDLQGASVMDIGGGPYSLLLKSVNGGVRMVVDPCRYPDWVYLRYGWMNINTLVEKGEELLERHPHISTYDEVWLYNCLQHTEDPEKVIASARGVGKIVRVFEWLNVPLSDGHLHILTEENMNRWLGGIGQTERIDENGAVGLGYFGIFIGRADQ